MANFYSWKGEYLKLNRKYVEASEYFKEDKNFFERAGLLKRQFTVNAKCMNPQVKYEMKNENYLKAKEYFKKASEIAKDLGDEINENWNLAKHYVVYL